MFYSSHVLTKKGPLAKIWLAAHMQSRLTKAMVFATDISTAVQSIFHPPAPMALRLTSNLLLGVARILFRKTKYLLHDSSEALSKLKTAYRPTAASTHRDLPPANVSFAAVTLPTPSTADLSLPAPLIDLAQLPVRPRPSAHSYRAAERDITIDEFAGGLSGGILDAFATTDFSADLPPDALADIHEPLVFTPTQRYAVREKPHTPSVRSVPSSVDPLRAADDQSPPTAPRLSLDHAHDTPDPMREAAPAIPLTPPILPVDPLSPPKAPATPLPAAAGDPAPVDVPAAEDTPARPSTPAPHDVVMEDTPTLAVEEAEISPAVATRLSTGADDLVLAPEPLATQPDDEALQVPREGDDADDAAAADDAVQQPDAAPKRGRKRKRVLVEDEATELSVEEFRRCLNDTSDLVLHPAARRRAGPGPRGRRPMSYEDLLARPTIGLAPQLSDLFAQSFSAGAAAQVGSPMSDVGMEKERVGSAEGADEEDTEASAVAPSPPRPVKEVVADPDITPLIVEDEAGRFSQSAEEALVAEMSGKRTDEVPSSPVQDEMVPGESPSRRLSLGTDLGVPVPEDESMFDVPAKPSEFDESKISLVDVAMTRSQVVEEGRGDGDEAEDVTENTISARTQKMQEYIVAHMDEEEGLNYSEMLASEPGMSRRTAARSFYELLNLSSKKALQLSQDGPYGTIKAMPLQPAFDALRRGAVH